MTFHGVGMDFFWNYTLGFMDLANEFSLHDLNRSKGTWEMGVLCRHIVYKWLNQFTENPDVLSLVQEFNLKSM